jgi:hypothetical protein
LTQAGLGSNLESKTNTLNKNIAQLLWILSLTGAGGCYASTIYGSPAPLAGTRTEDSGQIITGGVYNTDEGNLTLTWNISQIGNLFTYRYDVSGYQTPGISHFIISLSEGCSLDPNCITNGSNAVFGVYSGTDQGNSNAGFPLGTSIDGVKFGFGSEDSTTYTFTSDRAPVYGDFFLKGGKGPFAYDAGLANPGSSDLNAFIARPDTTSQIGLDVAAPEPGTLSLLGGGLLLLALVLRPCELFSVCGAGFSLRRASARLAGARY